MCVMGAKFVSTRTGIGFSPLWGRNDYDTRGIATYGVRRNRSPLLTSFMGRFFTQISLEFDQSKSTMPQPFVDSGLVKPELLHGMMLQRYKVSSVASGLTVNISFQGPLLCEEFGFVYCGGSHCARVHQPIRRPVGHLGNRRPRQQAGCQHQGPHSQVEVLFRHKITSTTKVRVGRQRSCPSHNCRCY